MIDSALIDMLGEGNSDRVKFALATLSSTGIYDQQIQVVKDQLLFGSSEETVESMAAAVIESRRRIQALATMKELGDSYKEILK